ncbi:MAG: hypothetical protein WD513_01895, partial [Balneolaceae bacterium]
MNFRLFIIFNLLLISGSSICNGQSSFDYLRAQLLERQQNTRSQIENIDRQIADYTARLNETTEEYDELYRQYEEINRLIALQQERLRQMNSEQRGIVEEIQLIERNIAELEKTLQRLINDYKSTLTYLYKHGRTTELALMLTSTSLNQLIIRSYYLSRFNDHVQAQVDEINETKRLHEASIVALEQTRARNLTVLAEIQQETANLEQQQAQQREIVNTLQSDIQNLERQMEIQQEQRDNLETTM